MLKKFLSYYKPHTKLFVLDMIASLFISLIGLTYPVVTRVMLDSFINRDDGFKRIIIAGSFILFLYIVRTFLRYFVQYYGHLIGTRMQAKMRSDMFTHLQKLPFSYYDNTETGDLISRISNDLFDVVELAHHGPENLIISSLTVIGSFIYLATINIYLTLIIFACVPFLIFVSAVLRQRMKEAFKERRITTAGINSATESSITGIRVTKAFSGSKKEMEKFEENNNLFVRACHKSYKAMAQFHSSSTFITDVFNVIIIVAGGLFLYAGKINVADYSTFIVSVNIFINPVTQLIGFMEQYQNGVSGFSRFLDLDSARRIGLLPAVETKVCGNLSLAGAAYAALKPSAVAEMAKNAEKIREIHLNDLPGFTEMFTKNLLLP
jgi:ATP-binding cassette subfamily B protein